MRIAYGVMGYGRGHAMRSSAMLEWLSREHEVRVYAGPDAYAVMKNQHDCELIPCIHYHYGPGGSIDPALTVKRNLRLSMDLLFGGARTRQLAASWDRFAPDLVISDSEAWSHQLARARGIPRISLDHVGIMAYCRPSFPAEDRLLAQRDRFGYLAMMGRPQHAIVSSFYPAEARYPNVSVVGPILRPLVYAAEPRQGKYLLAYFNKGTHQLHDALEQALRACGRPVVIYGAEREGRDENLLFRPPSQQGFVEDLAGCAAVIATAGHQLAAEALWLGKPMLLLPEAAVEQRLNAHMVQKMGIGERGCLRELSGYDIQRFLLRLDDYRSAIRRYRRDGLTESRQALAAAMARLSPRPAPVSGPPNSGSSAGRSAPDHPGTHGPGVHRSDCTAPPCGA